MKILELIISAKYTVRKVQIGNNYSKISSYRAQSQGIERKINGIIDDTNEYQTDVFPVIPKHIRWNLQGLRNFFYHLGEISRTLKIISLYIDDLQCFIFLS